MEEEFIIAGNWKANKTLDETRTFFETLKSGEIASHIRLVISPPFTHLSTASVALSDLGLRVALAAQDVSRHPCGAHTGEIPASFLKEFGAVHYALVGHSERRNESLCPETNSHVAEKVGPLLAAGLVPILCVGETLAEREAGVYKAVVKGQLDIVLRNHPASALWVAYEPVWAIGTGKVPSNADVDEITTFLREQLGNTKILYGGSVNSTNCLKLKQVKNVDGFLIGGASLDANKLLEICNLCL